MQLDPLRARTGPESRPRLSGRRDQAVRPAARPTSTTSSVVASVNSIRRLATTNATGIPNLSSMVMAAAE